MGSGFLKHKHDLAQLLLDADFEGFDKAMSKFVEIKQKLQSIERDVHAAKAVVSEQERLSISYAKKLSASNERKANAKHKLYEMKVEKARLERQLRLIQRGI